MNIYKVQPKVWKEECTKINSRNNILYIILSILIIIMATKTPNTTLNGSKYILF